MSTPIQIVIDCAEPHRLVRFWAEALGYEIEDSSELVAQVLAAGGATEADTVVVDGKRVWPDVACRDASGAGRPRLLFQGVPEPKAVKNRVHLDLQVGDERRDAEVERLLGLGARRIGEGRQGPFAWVVLADPEGNELCVT